MRLRTLIAIAVTLPSAVSAQTPTTHDSLDVIPLVYEQFADVFGSRLIAELDSIPAAKYDYKPTPPQQTVGYIAQHLEDANYDLCARFGGARRVMTSKDSLSDSVKARWPKDTLVARLRASFDYCASALERLDHPRSAMVMSSMLAFETDLAEHYSQLASYMRLLGLVPPTSLPEKQRVAIEVPASELSAYVGRYLLPHARVFYVEPRNGALFVHSNAGAPAVRLWPERTNEFFVKEVDAQITFTRDASGKVTGLVVHQFGRDRAGRKLP